MNNFQKLAQLSRDIEILENAGKFDAAEVLQRKFLKEAQADAYMGLATQDAKNFMMQLDQAYNSGQPTLAIMQKAERAGLSPQELQVLKNHAAKIKTQSNNDFNSQYPNTGYQTAEDTPATPARMPRMGPAQLATSTVPTLQPMPERSDEPQTQQQPVAQDSFQNYYTEQSDTANQMQAENANPNSQQESIEQKIYMNALNNIINAFKYNDRNTAEAIYNKTINEFTNPIRRDLFGKQIQRLRSQYLKPTK
jgi:hypothetical protein